MQTQILKRFTLIIPFFLLALSSCSSTLTPTSISPTYTVQRPSLTPKPSPVPPVHMATPRFLPDLAAGRYIIYNSDGQLLAKPISGGLAIQWPVRGDLDPLLSKSIYTEDGKLYQQNLDSGAIDQITIDGIDMQDIYKPSWGPDLVTIAFAATSVQLVDDKPIVDEFPSIYILDTRSHHWSRLTPWKTVEVFPSWSSDGNRLVFAADIVKVRDLPNLHINDTDLFMIQLDSTGTGSQPDIQQLTSTGMNDNASMPTWEPGGDRIAYTCGSYSPDPLLPEEIRWQQDICILDLESMSIENITDSIDIDEILPTWSSDGELLGYSFRSVSHDTGFNYDYMIIELTSRKVISQSDTFDVDEQLAYILDWTGR